MLVVHKLHESQTVLVSVVNGSPSVFTALHGMHVRGP